MSEPAPTLFLLGASHHTAPLELREKLALTGEKLEAFRADLQALAGLQEYAVLNTCNRVEIYGVAADPAAVARLEASFCARHQMDPDAFARIRLQLLDRPVVQHLLEVAAGIDSQVVGETEILGQVKDAYAAAQARGTTGPVLNRMFQKSFQAAKHVRTHTAIGEGQISVASVAVDLALKIFGDLRPCRVLVLGAGDIGEKTAKALKSRGASHLTVASRSFEHAGQLAATLGASALPLDCAPEALAEFDVAVCSTAAPEPVVTRPMAAAAMRRRPNQPLFFIDLAMPRNIAPEVAALPNVFLYNLDDLAAIADENLAQRRAETEQARTVLAEKAETLWRQLAPRMNGAHPPG